MLSRTMLVVQRSTLAIVAFWLAPLLLAGPACVDTPETDPWQNWKTLRLKAKSAPLLRGQVELRRSEDPDGRRLETSSVARFIGATIARSQTTTLIDATTGRPKEYRSYSKKKGRVYLFGEQGYTVEKLQPAKPRDAEPAWEVVSRREFPYPEPADGSGDSRLFDYYGMLLQLGGFALDSPGDEVTTHVATSKGPQAYRIRVSEARSGERTFKDATSGEKKTLPVREFRLVIIPADPKAEESFLKMEGEVEIWVEAESKTLLEIVGKVPKVPGKVKLVLSELG
jgi:hypothetical protein